MKTAKEIYPEYWKKEQERGSFYGPSDYTPILEQFGNIVLQVDDDDYQGDSRVLYEKDGKYGYLIFGWGSCSGCDSLQGCDKISQIQSLIDELENDISWFNSLDDLKEYFRSKDWVLEYSWHQDETKEFIEKVLNS